MELRFAICDDQLDQINVVRGYINQFQQKSDIKTTVIFAQSGNELLKALEEHPPIDLFIMDVEMPGINGILCSEKIRSSYPEALIVFVTGFKDYAFEAFGIKAYDYLLKPVTYEKMEKIFFKALSVKKASAASNTKKFTFQSHGMTYALNYDEIYYFEKFLRKVKIVFRGGEEEFYMSNTELEKNLDFDFFTRCHQSYIVNHQKIKLYKNQTLLVEELNLYLPVSKPNIKKVKELIHKNLLSK